MSNEISDALKTLLIAEVRESFWAYRQYMNPKMKKGWWQRTIARELQQYYVDLVSGNKPKLVIQAPPQHGKSEMIVDFIGWLSGQNPDLRTIYASYSDRLGTRANLRLQRAFDSPKYQAVFPGTRINSANVVTVSKQTLRNRSILEFAGREGYFRNTTVGGSIVGEGLDLGVIDDPVKGREEANSQTIRDKTWDWLLDDFYTRFSEDAGLLSILTRWHPDDPIGRLIEHMPDVKVVSFPAIATEDELHRRKGEALFPEHKSLEFLKAREAVMYPAYWEALYQQNPIMPEGNMFRLGKVEPVDEIPHGVTRWVRAWDFGATTDGNYSCGLLMGRYKDGRYIIADIVRGRWGPDERDTVVRNTAADDGREVLVSIPQDPGQAGKTQVVYLTRQLAGYRVTSSTESGDKAIRAEPVAAQMNVGNVLMRRGAWNRAFRDELTSFPNARYNDQVDALSRAFTELFVKGKTVWEVM